MVSSGLMALAFCVVLFIKERPLRKNTNSRAPGE